MDETINKRLRDHETQTDEWTFCELSNDLYRWFELFNERFFRGKLRTPVISFERTRCNRLGHFVIDRNALGLKWNININRLYADRPIAHTLATLLHEMAHQWQQEFGTKRRGRGRSNYHDVEFRRKVEQIGIPCDRNGATLFYRDPFVSFLRDHGVCIQQAAFSGYEKLFKKLEGGSKLKKWSCGCTNVRVAIRHFRARCLRCNSHFELSER